METAISEAKVFVYPSHEDSFPLAVLESLALGTTVVGYRIPGLKSYSKLGSVRLVPEWDKNELAKETLKILDLSREDYFYYHEDEKSKNFIGSHSSWDLVAFRETEILRKFFEHQN